VQPPVAGPLLSENKRGIPFPRRARLGPPQLALLLPLPDADRFLLQ
jgi:hypothetical protein